MSSPLVSIIIPVYNREILIIETLNSIKNQIYKNWECIVIDDGSSDNTMDVVQEFVTEDSRFLFFNRPDNINKGANGCRNFGFSKALGEFVNWFDSDDMMDPAFLQQKVNSFKKETTAVIHRNRYSNFELSRFRDSKFEYKDENSLFNDYALEKIELQTCSFLWKRSFLEKQNLFDPSIERYQDNEFHIRMLSRTKVQIEILSDVLATIRGGNGHSSQISHHQNLTKKKLWNVFCYRYKCIHLKYEFNMSTETNFDKIIGKKAFWAMYEALKFEKKISVRREDFRKYKNQLKFIYGLDSLSAFDVLKSRLYILRLKILS